MPKIGGFSFSSVPRPGAPLRRFRRPLRRFFYRRWLSFVTGHDIDFIALDGPLEDCRRLAFHDSLAPLRGHGLYVIFVEIQFLGNL